jgi:WD40 repeat protein
MVGPNEGIDKGCSRVCGSCTLSIAVMLAAVLFAFPTCGQPVSEELAAEPVLKIETGLHDAPIRAIGTDAENRFAVTAGDDKTARVWSLPDGNLQSVLHLPIGFGESGKARAVAISPDGRTIAVGGFTGTPGLYNIFLFDRASGALMQRLPDLPGVIYDLAYSLDGKRLAASLGSGGIRVFATDLGYQPLPSDTKYVRASRSAVFDQKGRLVTSSYDGLVRLYAANRYNVPIAQAAIQCKELYSAAFSPDGARVAAGCDDNLKVVILSGSNLAQLFEADPTGVSNTMGTVGWSTDGSLFGGGYADVKSGDGWLAGVRRWAGGGKGPFVDIPTGNDTIMRLVELKAGAILVADATSFGLINTNGSARRLQGFGALQLNPGAGRKLLISEDGRVVQVDSMAPQHSYRFSLEERRVTLDPADNITLKGAVTKAPGVDVTGWSNSENPAVNKTAIKLDQVNETSISLSIVPDTSHFVLGTDSRLHFLDEAGRELWGHPLAGPSEAWFVNVTSDGRMVVVAYGDGTIRWLRLSDGRELLSLFIHPDGKRWIAWTPQGYYDASVGGDDLIGWQVNHGYDHAPDFFKVAQFRNQFNRPDIVALVLKTLDEDEAVRQANSVSGRKAAAAVSDGLPPVVKIVSPPDLSSVTTSPIQVTYLLRSPTPVTGMTILVDGRPIASVAPKVIMSGAEGVLASLTIDMPQHNAAISLVATNQKASSEPAVVHIGWQGAKDWYKPDLYLLAVGVSKYNDKKLNLTYPDKDADDFVKVMQEEEGGLYNHVYVRELPDDRATRDEIRKGLSWLKKSTTSRDIAILFLSGHGQSDAGGHYHYLPFDSDISDLDLTTIQDYEIEDFLGKVPGKVLAFLDTCFSGDLQAKGPTQADVDKLANELASSERGVVVFTSSTGRQFSLERPEWSNGAFTKALVEAFKGGADYEHDKTISIAALELYLAHRVRELTDGEQSPMSTKPKTMENFVIGTVVP